jgi:three-Cys-motif partner protein
MGSSLDTRTTSPDGQAMRRMGVSHSSTATQEKAATRTEATASPLLLAVQAERAGLIRRDIKLAFVEPDANRRARLNTALSDAGVVPDVLMDRPFESVVDGLLDRYPDRAILIFVDPFGLGVTLDTLERILGLSSRRRPIDVLYHFSLLSVARMGRAALGQGDSSPNAKQLDSVLGAVGWREHLAGISAESGAATRAALGIGRSFATVVADRTGVPSLGIPVRPLSSELANGCCSTRTATAGFSATGSAVRATM